MRKSLLSLAVLTTLSAPILSFADDAMPAEEAKMEEAKPEHTFAYNIGLYSQYIFRGLTQTDEHLALQGGVDYTHSSGFYLGTWASNIDWLEDGGTYSSSDIELDLYGGYAATIGDTGIGYNLGLLQYVYPGNREPATVNADTTEVYGSLSYEWISAKVSVGVSDKVFGIKNADGTYYAELNANYPIGETGLTINAHVGRQDFDGKDNDIYSYTDWKLGLTKSWSNGINLGAYYTDTNARESAYTLDNNFIGDNYFTVFVQKVF